MPALEWCFIRALRLGPRVRRIHAAQIDFWKWRVHIPQMTAEKVTVALDVGS